VDVANFIAGRGTAVIQINCELLPAPSSE